MSDSETNQRTEALPRNNNGDASQPGSDLQSRFNRMLGGIAQRVPLPHGSNPERLQSTLLEMMESGRGQVVMTPNGVTLQVGPQFPQQSQSEQQPQQYHQHSASGPPGLPGHSTVIDMDDSAEGNIDDNSDMSDQGQADSLSNHTGGAQLTEGVGQLVNMPLVMNFVQKTGIFLIIILIKILYDHRLGLLVFAGLLGSTVYANSVVMVHISLTDQKQYKKSMRSVLWALTYLSGNLICIYYFFSESQLYKALYFVSPNFPVVDFWTLLWILMVADYTIKCGTIAVKALISLVPKPILKYKRKGNLYCFVEAMSQLYRGIIPLTPMFLYLLRSEESEGTQQWVDAILFILYTVAKFPLVLGSVKSVIKASRKVTLDVAYGTLPSHSELKEADSCPICHDNFTGPIKLACRHIFCEDCVSMWFDRDKTCPVCRANIGDDPQWRDGCTETRLMPF